TIFASTLVATLSGRIARCADERKGRREPQRNAEERTKSVENPYKSPTDQGVVATLGSWWPISGVSFGAIFGSCFIHVLLTLILAFRDAAFEVSGLRILIAMLLGGLAGGIVGLVWSLIAKRPKVRLIEWILLLAAIVSWFMFMPVWF
ncbi:MAG: hypothetical protein WD030_08250, partial [Pirellulales bacterium]